MEETMIVADFASLIQSTGAAACATSAPVPAAIAYRRLARGARQLDAMLWPPAASRPRQPDAGEREEVDQDEKAVEPDQDRARDSARVGRRWVGDPHHSRQTAAAKQKALKAMSMDRVARPNPAGKM
jgi:hypothetical protein